MIVLGIDQGNASGWGIVRGTPGLLGRVLASGVAKDAQARELAMRQALLYCDLHEPILAVVEDHRGMPLSRKTKHDRNGKAERSTSVLLGMGASVGKWQHMLELAGVEMRRVTPNEWFCRMSGLSAKTRTAERREWSILYVDGSIGSRVTHDEAAGVCIALWGALNLAPKAKG
jgi:hypothetical protein